MSNLLIYLDQNIIDPAVNISFESEENLKLVYSKEHFQEIQRSENPEQYLDVLEKFNAKLLEIELDHSFKPTGNAIVHNEGSPKQHFENFKSAISDVKIDNGLIDPLQAWLNGGGEKSKVEEFPDKLLEEFTNTIDLLPSHMKASLREDFNNNHQNLKNTVNEMIIQGNNLKKNREAIGNGKGQIGNVAGENQIEQIWKIIEPKLSGVSCEQFFGFESLLNNTNLTIHQSIIACCSVFDFIGFQAEKKSRKTHKISNVRSDAEHIAMASFCSVLYSTDGKLINRARAIYDYRQISTSPRLVNK